MLTSSANPLTVTAHVALAFPLDAVIVTLPLDTPVTRPLLLTDAIVEFEDSHATTPPVGVVVAIN